ncbi:expressed unknown protein (Partial), partial [Seminavis robusta]|eukprot:Sro2751_g336230.1 n/a (158) ;mRNA; f:11386-11859
MTNRRPSIAPVVSTYENTIQKNRQCGYDKDILGNKSTSPSRFNPDRRASDTIYHLHLRQQKQQEDDDQILKTPALRRMTLVDAMSPFRRGSMAEESPSWIQLKQQRDESFEEIPLDDEVSGQYPKVLSCRGNRRVSFGPVEIREFSTKEDENEPPSAI